MKEPIYIYAAVRTKRRGETERGREGWERQRQSVCVRENEERARRGSE